jgi:hypothetical protein
VYDIAVTPGSSHYGFSFMLAVMNHGQETQNLKAHDHGKLISSNHPLMSHDVTSHTSHNMSH